MQLDPLDVLLDQLVEAVLLGEKALGAPLLQRRTANQRIGERPRTVGLARARRAIEDEVLLVEQETEVAGPFLPVGVGLPDSVQRREVEVDRAAVKVGLDPQLLQRSTNPK